MKYKHVRLLFNTFTTVKEKFIMAEIRKQKIPKAPHRENDYKVLLKNYHTQVRCSASEFYVDALHLNTYVYIFREQHP